jgi:hypothetical protein
MLFSLVFASAAIAAVQPDAAAPPQSQAPAPAVKERKICRSEQVIGSLTPKRTCKSRAEWNALLGLPGKSGKETATDAQSPSGDSN